MSEDITIDPKILAEIDLFEKIASEKEIHTEADEADAVKFGQMVKRRAKELNTERLKHTKPINDKKKAIDKLYRAPLNRLAEVEKKIKKGIFTSVQAREERNRQAMVAAQNAAQSGGNVTQHLDAIDDRPLPPSTSMRRRWEYNITNPNRVPPHLWSPDPRKIEAELSKHTDFANPPTIPGVEITVGGSMTIRTK